MAVRISDELRRNPERTIFEREIWFGIMAAGTDTYTFRDGDHRVSKKSTPEALKRVVRESQERIVRRLVWSARSAMVFSAVVVLGLCPNTSRRFLSIR